MRRGVRIGVASVAAAAVIGGGAAIAVPGLATGGGSSTATTASGTAASTTLVAATTTTPQANATRPDPGERREEYQKALAKELGIDLATLQAAEKKARAAVFVSHLDEMVSSGRLTQAQADQLREAAQNGKLEETLKAQARARLKAALDGQVKAGLLTQAQADAMLKQFDEGGGGRIPGLGFGGRGGHHGPGPGGGPGIP